MNILHFALFTKYPSRLSWAQK